MRPHTLMPALGAVASVLGGALFLLFGAVFFLFTHGSTSTDRSGTLFGLDGTDFCRMQVTWPLLLVAAVIALRRRYLVTGPATARGASTAVIAALVLHAVGIVLQCWITDPHNPVDFESTAHLSGFYLGALSYLMLTGGLIALGTTTSRHKVLPRWNVLPLGIGAAMVPALLLEVGVVRPSTGTLTWDLAYAMLRLPTAIGWAALGLLLLGSAPEEPPNSDGPHRADIPVNRGENRPT